MRMAMFRVMLLSLLRDRATLAMSFILPGLVFVIFAIMFSAASGGDLTVRFALADERQDPPSRRLVESVLADRRLVRVGGDGATAETVRELLRSGSADVGVVLRRTGRPLDIMDGEGKPPILLMADPAREIAVSVVTGILQQSYVSAVPEAAIRSISDVVDRKFARFSPEQKIRVEKGLDAMRDRTVAADAPQGLMLDRIWERENAMVATAASPAVIYYAGGVAMMFMLFSALTGAMSFVEQRESGLLDRLAIGPGGVGVLIDGKFMFLVVQGMIQVLLIYLVAWGLFGVDLPGNILPWTVTTFAAALAAAGLALAFVTMCRSRQQAQTLGQMLILVLSAVGGSMVPRYLMPASFQAVGWATPNTWAIEAYSGIFYRQDSLPDLAVAWSILVAIGLVSLTVAHLVARRSV